MGAAVAVCRTVSHHSKLCVLFGLVHRMKSFRIFYIICSTQHVCVCGAPAAYACFEYTNGWWQFRIKWERRRRRQWSRHRKRIFDFQTNTHQTIRILLYRARERHWSRRSWNKHDKTFCVRDYPPLSRRRRRCRSLRTAVAIEEEITLFWGAIHCLPKLYCSISAFVCELTGKWIRTEKWENKNFET